MEGRTPEPSWSGGTTVGRTQRKLRVGTVRITTADAAIGMQTTPDSNRRLSARKPAAQNRATVPQVDAMRGQRARRTLRLILLIER